MTVKFVDQKDLSLIGSIDLQIPPAEGQVVFMDEIPYCVLRLHNGIYMKRNKKKSYEEITAYCKKC